MRKWNLILVMMYVTHLWHGEGVTYLLFLAIETGVLFVDYLTSKFVLSVGRCILCSGKS